MAASAPGTDNEKLGLRHVRFGWWCLLAFLSLGVILEALHGLKVGWYLDVTHQTRRHLLTLAHAHGALFSLVNIVFGLCLRVGVLTVPGIVSPCLVVGSLGVPLGFFLGGLTIYAGDPGLGVFLVPFGAGFMLVAVALAALGAAKSRE